MNYNKFDYLESIIMDHLKIRGPKTKTMLTMKTKKLENIMMCYKIPENNKCEKIK
jgi:hypothetical protein